MNKNIIIIGVVAVLLIVGVWLSKAPVSRAPVTEGLPLQDATGTTLQTGDTTGIINQDLQNITVEEPDFQSIDSDLNSL
ncbi:MAG: hypothetical protein HY433_01470 [Candidatus Liptonbacteria bacterium]|nr:hypothetical protein [Candidatus Liptonbacteria bacterium]